LARKAVARILAEHIRLELLPKSEELHVGILNTPNGRNAIGIVAEKLRAPAREIRTKPSQLAA
jgi:hypothetical protein